MLLKLDNEKIVLSIECPQDAVDSYKRLLKSIFETNLESNFQKILFLNNEKLEKLKIKKKRRETLL